MKGSVKLALSIMAISLVAPFLLVPSPVSAQEGEVTSSSSPRWGILARGGYYGVPDWILDQLFEKHPDVDGTIFGGEIRYYGDGGPSGNLSLGLGFDIGQSDGFGTWQENTGDVIIVGGGEVDIVAGHITAYWDLFASSPIHPYIGIGGGVGYAEGRYVRDIEEVNVKEYVPVIHIPVGIVLNLGDNFGIGAEARVIDGISFGGTLQLRF